MSKRKNAERIYEIFVQDWKKNVGETTPLINFTGFLLQSLSRQNSYPLFQTLTQRYAKAIERDAEFNDYLTHIAKLYYNVAPQKNFFNQLLQSFLGGNDDV